MQRQTLFWSVPAFCMLVLLNGCGSGGGAPAGSTDSSGSGAAPATPAATRTLVVSRQPNAEFGTIDAALKAANPGDTIKVQPGTYTVPLAIVKPVTLAGDGPREQIVISSANMAAITSTAADATLSNLTINFTGKNQTGIRVRAGKLTMKDCTVSAPNESNGAEVEKAGSLVLQKCTFQKCAIAVFAAGGKLLLEGCTVSDCKKFGVGSNNHADVICKGSTFTRNAGGGLAIEQSNGTIEDNDIGEDGAEATAIWVPANGTASVKRNKLHGDKNGELVEGGGTLLSEKNDIYGNEYGIYGCDKTGKCALSEDKVHGNSASGIHFQDDSTVTVTGCDVFENSITENDAAVSIALGANANLRGCKVRNNHSNGIALHHRGRGTIEDCDIHDNHYPGLDINSQGKATAIRNMIYGHGGFGVKLDQGEATFESNEIHDNGWGGIRVRDHSQVTAHKNHIFKNSGSAFVVVDNSGGTFEENDLRENELGGWDIEPACRAAVHHHKNAEDVTPLSTAKVGDWLEKTMITRPSPATTVETQARQTVTAVTEDDITIETQKLTNGKLSTSTEVLPTGTHTDFMSIFLTRVPDATVDPEGKSTESMTIGGKTLNTEVTRYKITRELDDKKTIVLHATIWTARGVPIDQIVRSKSEFAGFTNAESIVTGFGDANTAPKEKFGTPPAGPPASTTAKEPPAASKPAAGTPAAEKSAPVKNESVAAKAAEKPAAKKRTTIFVMKDGQRIKSVQAVELENEVQIKTEAGEFQTLKKDDIVEKIAE